ncbi:transcription termination factor MTERF15, mitochondrial [Nymphaea colorata]|uniref:Uncharacterized protein n=1 Tax=Nymphaea colorata TaxID=210225 RepID=A0A5K1GYU2_9MAGN|nr:transcription termination factor MTERF15, mitochondrial [Nymphaea colorata]
MGSESRKFPRVPRTQLLAGPQAVTASGSALIQQRQVRQGAGPLSSAMRVGGALLRTLQHRLRSSSSSFLPQLPPPSFLPLFRTTATSARRTPHVPAAPAFPVADLLVRSGFPAEFLADFTAKNPYVLSLDPSGCEKCVSKLFSFGLSRESLASVLFSNPGVLEPRRLGKIEAVFAVVEDFDNSSAIMRKVLEFSGRLSMEPCDVRENIGFLRSCGISEFLIPHLLEESPWLVFLDRRLELEPSAGIMRDVGMRSETITRILIDFPQLFKLGARQIASRVNYLKGIGFRAEEIDSIVGDFPAILKFGVEDRLKPLISEMRDLGFGFLEIKKAAIEDPRIFQIEAGGELSRCVNLLKKLKCRLPIKEKILDNGVLRASVEVKLRIDCLCRSGLSHRDAFKLLWREPRIIIYDLEDVQKKINFLTDEIGDPISLLVEVPEYLGVNLERQIIPRYKVVQWLRSHGGLGIEVGLKDLVKSSRHKFYNFFVKPYPECERIFGKMNREAVPRSRPAVELSQLLKPQKYKECEKDSENIKMFMKSLV